MYLTLPNSGTWLLLYAYGNKYVDSQRDNKWCLLMALIKWSQMVHKGVHAAKSFLFFFQPCFLDSWIFRC